MIKYIMGMLTIVILIGSGYAINSIPKKTDSSTVNTTKLPELTKNINDNKLVITELTKSNLYVLDKLARLEMKFNKKPKSEYEFIRRDVGSKVVTIKGGLSGGSGFFVTAPSGKTYIMTNRHICALRSKEGLLDVKLEGGDRFIPKKVIEVFKSRDLCLVEGFVMVQGLSVGEAPEIGSITYTVGHPKLYPLIVSKGQYIGARDIKIAIYKNYRTVIEPNRFSVPLASGYPKFRYEIYSTSQIFGYSRGGSSGSPIVNQKGEIVSVLFAGNNGDNMDSYGVPYSQIVNLLKTY